MNEKIRYAIVGTGSRAGLFVQALTQTYADHATLAAFCDSSQHRMDWYNRSLEAQGSPPVPTYDTESFQRMLREQRIHTVIVTTVDAWHHHYIILALEGGCHVICEKPLTTTLEGLQAIDQALERSGLTLRVAFNYRFAPAYARLRELLQQGIVGKPLAVDFSWLLDTSHGADYFRRWHRDKAKSGGLLVHKATHHFDLVNWWLDSVPRKVFAMGDLLFYGKQNAAARGEHYSYARYTGEPAAQSDPFALFLDKKDAFRGLYLDAESESGYIRDGNVFGENITAEDTMAVLARYANGALLSYCLVAYAPWEGLRIAFTGTAGRLELDIVENVSQLKTEAGPASASKGAFAHASIRAYPMFGQAYELDVPRGQGGHGGADPLMLAQLFAPQPLPDPLQQAATYRDGAASILLGIAANRSIETGEMVDAEQLFALPPRT